MKEVGGDVDLRAQIYPLGRPELHARKCPAPLCAPPMVSMVQYTHLTVSPGVVHTPLVTPLGGGSREQESKGRVVEGKYFMLGLMGRRKEPQKAAV